MKRKWIMIYSLLLEALMFGGLLTGIIFLRAGFWSGSWMGAILVGAYVAISAVVTLLLAYFWWAPNNIWFTFVPEGRAKIVLRGDAVRKVLIQWERHELSTERVLADPANPNSKVVKDVGDVIDCGFRHRWLGGLYLYGLWPFDDLYIYDFKWTNMAQDGQIQPHDEEGLDYVLLKDDVYWAAVKAAEDKNLLPLDVGLVLRLRVLNPQKALFAVENWLETVINLVQPAVRYVLFTDTYENWVRLPKDLGAEVLLKLKGEQLVKELRLRYGIEVISIGVKSFDPSPLASLDETRRATLQRYLAIQQKKKTIIDAGARKKALTLEGQGEAAGIAAVQALGQDAMQLRGLEVISDKGNSTFVLPGSGQPVSVILPAPNARGAQGNNRGQPNPNAGGQGG